MKHFILLFCFLMTNSISYAQKSYVVLSHSLKSWYLSGDIPAGMQETYAANPNVTGQPEKVVAGILNELSEKGYEVEFMPDKSNYLLSKKPSNSYSSVRRVQIDDDDVMEIARYNLQGLPVSENEKGVQIIVYSNYTTKTVIVQ